MAKVNFTAGRVEAHKCPPGKQQAFLWDSASPGLGVRATVAGSKSYVFQGEFNGKTVRITIGSPEAWTIPQAQERARELQRLIDQGRDPRVVKAEAVAADTAAREATQRSQVTMQEAWNAYLEERKPVWGDLHYRDHVDKSKAGGKESNKRGDKKRATRPGPLFSLMHLPLSKLDAQTVEAWAAREGATRPASARLAWRLLKVFLNWCAEQPAYAAALPDKNPAATKKAREALGSPAVKSDVLQREQLKAWFEHVGRIQNATVSACLQIMLLTGARPGEVRSIKWGDVDTQWRSITIRDKVEGLRVIPLTPYVAKLISQLPRANDWVFASARWVKPINDKNGKEERAGKWVDTSKSGRIAEPNTPHTKACAAAGLDGLTLHGLRRSFASLTEWLEIPAGVVAQIQGHKPSATAEKHYKVRPLELLRVHHERIEAWILEQAAVTSEATHQPHLKAVL